MKPITREQIRSWGKSLQPVARSMVDSMLEDERRDHDRRVRRAARTAFGVPPGLSFIGPRVSIRVKDW